MSYLYLGNAGCFCGDCLDSSFMLPVLSGSCTVGDSVNLVSILPLIDDPWDLMFRLSCLKLSFIRRN